MEAATFLRLRRTVFGWQLKERDKAFVDVSLLRAMSTRAFGPMDCHLPVPLTWASRVTKTATALVFSDGCAFRLPPGPTSRS